MDPKNSKNHKDAEALHPANITRRKIFDTLVGNKDTKPKIEGLKVRSPSFVSEVMSEVCALNSVKHSELNTVSLFELKSKVSYVISKLLFVGFVEK